MISYINKDEISLEDASDYAVQMDNEAGSTIIKGLTNKLDKIAKQIFGEDRYRKPFADFD